MDDRPVQNRKLGKAPPANVRFNTVFLQGYAVVSGAWDPKHWGKPDRRPHGAFSCLLEPPEDEYDDDDADPYFDDDVAIANAVISSWKEKGLTRRRVNNIGERARSGVCRHGHARAEFGAVRHGRIICRRCWSLASQRCKATRRLKAIISLELLEALVMTPI